MAQNKKPLKRASKIKIQKKNSTPTILGRPKREVMGFMSIFAIAGLVFLGASNAQSQRTISASAQKGYVGEIALRRLGNKLPDVATRYNISPEKLKELLSNDPTLRLSDKDELFYVEPALTIDDIYQTANSANQVSETSLSASIPKEDAIPLENALDLNSKVGSSKTIYLDFDGHTTAEEHWTNYNGGDIVTSEPYDHDGDPSSFSATERQSIIDIWSSVAEDFSHLDINVTTKDPGMDALIKSNSSDTTYGNRTVITPSNFYSPSAGGVSYVGTWGLSKDYVSYVFICCEVSSTKYIAEAAAHETGHSVGLHHDGTADLTYYPGHGDWAPIMGVGYYKNMTQWSKGEYQGANQKQDDLIFPLRYGIVNRQDEAGNTISKAAPLALDAASKSRKGFIATTGDIDVYSFDWKGGTVNFEVGSPVYVQNFGSGVTTASNLDPSIRILNVLGLEIAQNNPDGPTPASISKYLLRGRYYIEIRGSGYMDPLTTGYSNYSSVGQYKILQR